MAFIVAAWSRSRSLQRLSLGLGLVLAATVAVIAFNSLSPASDSGTLAPAKQPSVDTLCSLPLDASTKGDVSPLFCTDGSINVLAWNALAAGRPAVMSLDRDATAKMVRAAVALDLATNMPGVQECNAAMLAAAYYGWNFHIDPVDGLSLDCPVQK